MNPRHVAAQFLLVCVLLHQGLCFVHAAVLSHSGLISEADRCGAFLVDMHCCAGCAIVSACIQGLAAIRLCCNRPLILPQHMLSCLTVVVWQLGCQGLCCITMSSKTCKGCIESPASAMLHGQAAVHVTPPLLCPGHHQQYMLVQFLGSVAALYHCLKLRCHRAVSQSVATCSMA